MQRKKINCQLLFNFCDNFILWLQLWDEEVYQLLWVALGRYERICLYDVCGCMRKTKWEKECTGFSSKYDKAQCTGMQAAQKTLGRTFVPYCIFYGLQDLTMDTRPKGKGITGIFGVSSQVFGINCTKNWQCCLRKNTSLLRNSLLVQIKGVACTKQKVRYWLQNSC